MNMKVILLLSLFLTFSCHPSPYPKQHNNSTCSLSNPPQIVSYHMHIVYMLSNPDEILQAMELRERSRQQFKGFLGPDCDHSFDEGRLCLINDHAFNTTVGPFPVGQWSMFVPLTYLGMVIPWFSQNRGRFSSYVHPNSGCMYQDHNEWAYWSGEKWPIDLTIFQKDVKANELDHYAGDAANPTCVTESFNCGSPDFYGPGLACCENTTCVCDRIDRKKCTCQKFKSYKNLSS